MPSVDVYSDGDPKELNAISLAIYRVWVEFALGQRTLGGRRLLKPTGSYASSIKIEMQGKNHVSIMAVGETAETLEKGHRSYSMLQYLSPGSRIPIHRSGFVQGPGPRYSINPRTGLPSRARSSGVRVTGRFVSSLSGIVRVPKEVSGSNTSGTGPAWTVPAMPAYAPTRHLADLFRQRALGLSGGAISFAP
jgi:hypothetical protein